MYSHKEIEQKWREQWEKNSVYKTSEDDRKEKCFAMVMFPYPSGDGLHAGHARVYIGADIYARMKRMRGCAVLHPMGWDAFGLPAEEYAIKNKQHPRESTERNIATFREQQNRLGLSYDWEREINTTDPAFYRWTQWIFLQLFKKGLAYESHAPVNWCPSCKTGLANEDLEGGKCERCGSAIERKPIRQWMLRITKYADRLVDDLETLPGWSDHVKEVQRNWIGRGAGYSIPFPVRAGGNAKDAGGNTGGAGKSVITIKIFTTRPDTLFGCSFLALSPESEYLETLLPLAQNKETIEQYRNDAYGRKPSEQEKEQTGVPLEGVHAVHPITGKKIPVFVADYVLGGYGTGAIFGSPAHDERDFAFATRYNLPIVRVVSDGENNKLPITDTQPDAPLINSGEYNGTPSEEAKEILTKAAGGEKKVVYRLQDWVFSRQRYWGEPIPLIHCEKCGVVPVPEEDLPVTLPEVDSYKPTGTAESPLAAVEEWVRVQCPACDGEAKRETNTMPQWAGSSWYQLRYIDPNNTEKIIDGKKETRWMPVDIYTGGMEHAARHLIYARFWHKVLHDIGTVSTAEPYATLKTVGILQAEGGGKMSKRLGNVINPITVVDAVGADAFRIYIAHIAPFSQTVAWDSRAIAGPRRFLERVYAMRERIDDSDPSENITRLQHKTILSVTNDIEQYRFNTAVASLMIFTNALQESERVPKSAYIALLQLLAPFAPYLTEEIWHELGNTESIHLTPPPTGDAARALDEEITIAVQINGKVRGTVTVSRDSAQETVMAMIEKNERLKTHTRNKTVKIFIQNKIISFT